MYHLRQIPSDTKIRKFLRQILFGDHLFCPQCRSFDVVRYESRHRCKKCRAKFSLLSHTWLKDVRIQIKSFWLILWCFTKQIPVKQTEEITSLSEKAVRHWFDLFRANLPQHKETLEHIIQLDEAYFGGWGGRALLMGKQPGTRKIAYKLFPKDSVDRSEALSFLETFVKPGSKLNTDGATIYKGIDNYFPVMHTVDIHKKFEFTNTSEIEGMFGVLRTFIRRMYHHVSDEKLDEYLCEFYFRFCRPKMFTSIHQYLKNTLVLVPSG